MAHTKKSLYSLHPGFAMEATSAVNVKTRTGKSLDQWIGLVRKSGPPTWKERVAWLMTAHKLTTNYARWVADRAEGHGAAEDYDPEAMVEAMYAEKKTALRPIYDALLALGLKQGPDVRACPCKTIVPLYRCHVFAQIKPTTQTRVDLGLALGDTRATGRLVDTGGFQKKDRITHRIPISSLGEIDDEVRRWLKTAYERDA